MPAETKNRGNGELALILSEDSRRRDQERNRFAALMRKVEALRLRLGVSKAELKAFLTR